MKKEEAIKEIGRLKGIIERYEGQDKDVRRNFTNLLREYPDTGWGRMDKNADMTWIEIAFHIGELRADADIQGMIIREQNIRQELETLKNPKQITP